MAVLSPHAHAPGRRQSADSALPAVTFSCRLDLATSVCRLEVHGALDEQTSGPLADAVEVLASRAPRHVVINLRTMTEMDSDGYGALVAAVCALQACGATVGVLHAPDLAHGTLAGLGCLTS